MAQRFGWFPSGGNWYMPFLIIGGNGPPIAAYFVLKRADPDFTFKRFLKFSFDVKQRPVYYIFAVLTIALFFIVPALTGGLEAGTAPGLEGLNITGHIPLYITLPGIPLFFFLGGSEEIGWRGVMQPELEKKMPFLTATLITAFVWTVWHLPLWWMTGSTQADVNFWLFFIEIIGLSFVLASVRRVSGSVILCVLIHCATNCLQGTWPIKDDLMTKTSTAAVLVLFSLIIILCKKKLSQHK